MSMKLILLTWQSQYVILTNEVLVMALEKSVTQNEFLTKSGVRKYLLGEMLVDANIITQEQLLQTQKIQENTHERLGYIMVQLGYITEELLLDFLSKQLNIPRVSFIEIGKIDEDVAKCIPEFAIRKYRLFPISKEGNTITVAMANPLDVLAIDDIKLMVGKDCNIQIAIASEREIRGAIEKYYAESVLLKEFVDELVPDESLDRFEILTENWETMDVDKLTSEAEETPVIKLVNHILMDAIINNASDVHIEPWEEKIRIRYRIDGILYDTLYPPKRLQRPIISRIKIMSRLDITQTRLAQDGRCKIRVAGREIDLRTSSTPTKFGERIVIRILDPESLRLDLTQLGFEPDILQIYQKYIHYSSGMILITGPTGSGKTTTLYSTLATINVPEKNIMTIEDPIEYFLLGINQQQINPQIGLTFVEGLKSFFRQDPDIIMIGEIRDTETAEVAINAALTGHLVFATLHTNDAPGAIIRLLNMKILPYLITSTLLVGIAQRLVRILCSRCKVSYEISSHVLEDIGIKIEQEKIGIYKAVGCKYCSNTGYKGRIGVFEVMTLSDEIRDLVLEQASPNVIKKACRDAGMATLQDVTAKKVIAGITTIEEYLRIIY